MTLVPPGIRWKERTALQLQSDFEGAKFDSRGRKDQGLMGNEGIPMAVVAKWRLRRTPHPEIQG